MQFKVGDKVKFLDEPGGGVITKIISSRLVTVTIEDGFEIPTMVSELILETSQDEQSKTTIKEHVNEIYEQKDKESVFEESRISPLNKSNSKISNEPGIYMVFVPHDQKWLVTGLVDLYLINLSQYDILYSFFIINSEKYTGVDYGSITPNSKVLIETINRDDIEYWLSGIVQLLFHGDKLSSIMLPVNSEFKIKSTLFINENNYQNISYLEDRGIVYTLTTILNLESVHKPEIERKYESTADIKKEAKKLKPKSLIGKYETKPQEAIVDLHLKEVIDSDRELSKHDMLKIQVDQFIKCLESAIENKYKKITFIHGVGNSSLKYAIMEKIKEYEGLENYDASLAKFGVGAVDIIIRYNI